MVAALLCMPRPASAYQIETSATSGCHERITRNAVVRAGWPGGASPPAMTQLDRQIAGDAPFATSAGFEDRWSVALLIGVRHNDVGSASSFDLPSLATIHADPERQPEHCLRKQSHDFEDGDRMALASCRAFILEQVALALGDEEEIDLDRTVLVETSLVFRGRVDLALPAYPFHLGRALHALQDSYTHSFRHPDTSAVRHVFNWVEGNGGLDHDLDRDGHPHLSELDECAERPDAREARAITASAALMAALADPTGGRAGRLARAEAVLDDEFAREPGCTADNGWCGAPEADPDAVRCAAAGGAGATGTSALLLLLAAPAVLARRRRRTRRPPAAALAGAAVLAAALALAPGSARAQDEAPPVEGPADAPTEQALEREEAVLETLPDPVLQRFGAALSVGGALDRAAGAFGVGVRWNPWRSVGLGLDAEYNPWISISNRDAAPGVASVYVPVIWRLQRFGSWELRTTAYAGATMILFDMVGVERGNVGLFAGWNPLGLAWATGTSTKVVLKPGDIVIPAPQLSGIPYYYPQYRFTVGLEWYP